jgi:hypothetical protein
VSFRPLRRYWARPLSHSSGESRSLPGGCSTSTEIAVRHQPKRLFGIVRNRCTAHSETTVRFRPKYTLIFGEPRVTLLVMHLPLAG